MTTGILKWRTETCRCKFTFNVDIPDGEKIDFTGMTPTEITPCEEHSHIRDNLERLVTVHDEHRRWHHTLGFILENAEEGVRIAENGGREFHQTHHATPRYAANRKLMVDMRGFTTREKQRLQGLLDEELGAGKVVLE